MPSFLNIPNIVKEIRNRTYFALVFSLCFLSQQFVVAQENRIPYSSNIYGYINYDSCFLENYGSNAQMEKFYDKLDKLCFDGVGQISILHLGGSHIQAGIWSWELRKKFESLCPGMEGAPGMVFPFSIAATNHPYYYKSSFTGDWEISKITDKEPSEKIGLSGITAYTYDSVAEIIISFTPAANIEKHKFNKISIFHNVEDTAYLLSVSPEEFLDSCIENLISGTSEYYFSEYLDSVKIKIVKQDTSFSKFCFYGAYLQNSLPGINYTGIGINGASTHSYLKAESFKQHLTLLNPDLAILSIGVNDASGPAFSEDNYIKNYSKILYMIREVNPDCAIIFTTNNDFYYYRGGSNMHYNEVYSGMLKIAENYGCSVWNMFRVMGGLKSINLWKKDKLANNDRIHFTRDGYSLIAGLFFDAILRDYETHLLKNNGKNDLKD